MAIKKYILIIIFALTVQALHSQGLMFNGMSHRIQERTSYDVFGSHTMSFGDSLKLSFDIYFLPNNRFGYIFRLKDKCNWNLSYENNGEEVLFRLNEEGRISHIKAGFSNSRIPNMHWKHMEVCFDFKSDSLYLSFADTNYRVSADLPDSMSPQIIFGKSDFLIDVPDFAIRNLEISGSGTERRFPLNQLDGNIVYDSSRRVKGFVDNPTWLMNDALSWKKEVSLKSETIAGACWNSVRQQMCYFNKDSIYVYDYLSGKISRTGYPQVCPVRLKLGSNFISKDGKWLYSYELYDENQPAGAVSVARLNLDTCQWESISTCRLDMPMNHHAGFTNPENGEYSVFGGFGDMLYNGRFFSLDLSDGAWTQQEYAGDRIAPRYFTSVGTDDNCIYVFGGMGNDCGEQVVGRRYYYDFYRIDTCSGNVELLWNLDWEGEDQVPVRRLVVDGDAFYTLCYPEYKSKSNLRLFRYSIQDGNYEILCNDIPIISDKMRTNANIFLDKDLGKFLALVLVFDDDIKSELTLYTLNYPALNQEEILRIRQEGNGIWLWMAVCIVLIASAGLSIGLVVVRKRRKNRLKVYIRGREAKIFHQTLIPNAVYLFGDFTVTDRNGEDISNYFTPQLQTILILLIQRNAKGISSKRISTLLWPDKDEDKVKNSRGVAINSLRKVLSNLDGVDIFFEAGRYRIEFAPVAYCDYIDFSASLERKDIATVTTVASRGKYLNGIDNPLFDTYKDRVDNNIVPLLHSELTERQKSNDHLATVEIADILLSIDPLDEKALLAAVRSLKKSRCIEDALVKYASFCSEHKKSYGTEYKKDFDKI